MTGAIPKERPGGVPQHIPVWAWSCLRERNPVPPPLKPLPVRDPYAKLGVFERVAFFVNSGAASPVGGAHEIVSAAATAGVTCAAYNVGDPNDWRGWTFIPGRRWSRCDTAPRCQGLNEGAIANIESPEMNSGFCTPARAVELVGPRGGIITEGEAPHADWKPVGDMPVWLEIDPTVAAIREKLTSIGVRGLVDYAHSLGIQVPLPAFFVVPSDMWDGSQATFATYWDQLREMWPAPLPFGIYNAELVPDWSVIS